MKTIALLVTLICFCPSVAALTDPAPLVCARKAAGFDATLLGAPNIGRLINVGGRDYPTQRTEVGVCYDDANLYVFFNCWEADMSKVVPEYMGHDEQLYRDDCVEVFLDTNHDHNTYYQVIANTAGVQFDAKNNAGPDSWNGEWRVTIDKNPDGWIALVTIPFSSIGVKTPPPGTVWGASFERRQKSRAEVSFWTVMESGSHEPARFGDLVFGTKDTPVVRAEPLEVKALGSYTARLTVGNASSHAMNLVAEPQVDGRPLVTARKSSPPGESAWSFPFTYSEEGKRRLCITVRDAKGSVIMQTLSTTVDIPPHRARLSFYLKEARAFKPPTAEARQRKAELLRALKQISSLAAQTEQGGGRWTRLGAALDAVSPQFTGLRYLCADRTASGYAVGRETSILKLRRDLPFNGDFASPLRISACRSEYEAAQLVIVPYSKALTRVSVSVSNLKGPNGTTIPVQLNRVDYVKTRGPAYPVDYIGWYPDPLMDDAPFDAAKGLIQPIWVTVHPSENAPAGVYKGKLTVAPANAPAQTVPLEVRVWNFAMPRTVHLKTAFAMCEGQLGGWYHGLTPEIRRAYNGFMLEHRINPTNIYSPTPLPTMENLPFAVERGLNAFNLSYISADMNEAEREALLKMLKEYETFLKAKGWWDKAYIYGFDEPQPDKIPAIKSMFGWVKQHFPDLPRMCTTAPNPELKGYVDIWCPILHGYNSDVAREYVKAGDQVWWYVAWIPSRPYPNFLMDNPAIDHRVVFWMNWKYQVPGFLYYFVNFWTSNFTPCEKQESWFWPQEPDVLAGLKAGRRWPEIPWNTFTCSNCNGDGQLIYPGPNGKPISSVRMEMIRDGIEDYEYYYMLNELVAKAEKSGKADPALLAKARKLLVIDDGVVKSTSDYTKDPRVLLKARQAVAEMIEKLHSAL